MVTDLLQRCSSAKARQGEVAEDDIPSTFRERCGKCSRAVDLLELDRIFRFGQLPYH